MRVNKKFILIEWLLVTFMGVGAVIFKIAGHYFTDLIMVCYYALMMAVVVVFGAFLQDKMLKGALIVLVVIGFSIYSLMPEKHESAEVVEVLNLNEHSLIQPSGSEQGNMIRQNFDYIPSIQVDPNGVWRVDGIDRAEGGVNRSGVSP